MKNLRDLVAGTLLCCITLVGLLLTSCTSDDGVDLEGDDTSTDTEINPEVVKWIDDKLSNYYLYNDEYNAMDRDLTLDYSSFLNTTLKSMKTNTLDKKYNEMVNGLPYYDYLLYSNVSREAAVNSRSLLDSRYGVGYGFVETEFASLPDHSNAILIHGVYPGSPAAELGLSRGDIITAIDGQTINLKNYYFDLFYMLNNPQDGDEITITTYHGGDYTLTASTIEVNPILHKEIIDPGIGYVVYSTFDNNFNNDLTQTFEELASAGITDLILDLRLNPGGHVSAAQLLSSIIGGSYATGKVFSNYKLNENMTNDYTNTSNMTGMIYDSTNQTFYNNFITSTTTLALASPKIYCLVSKITASASEMLINSLRGIGFEVVLIGETTEGKNVGMLTFNETFDDGYKYQLLPITFENFNCNMEGGYQDGMAVDYEIDDLSWFIDYGTEEPLVAKALELITGITPEVDSTRSADTLRLISVGGKVNLANRGGSIIEIHE